MDISESELKSACADLIAEAVATAKALYNGVFPLVDVPTLWLEPKNEGGYQGEPRTISMLDLGLTWKSSRDFLAGGPKWMQAEEAIENYQKAKGTAGEQGFRSDNLCDQIVINYLSKAENFELQEKKVDSVCDALVAYCDSKDDIFKSVTALEGFTAPEAFQLDENVLIRPVNLEELEELGQEHPMVSNRRPGFEAFGPKSDWWICEITQSGPKGTSIAWNKLHEIFPAVGLCLRLFKAGKCTMDTFRIAKGGAFGPSMYGWGGRTVLSSRGSLYSLTAEEVPQLQAFWPIVLELMNQEKHYLQLPARRLQFGGERSRLEDSLIDYMIGLESLLGEGNAEISYRMAMRGAVILSSGSTGRFNKFKNLRNLYDLRSKIVHGVFVEPSKLNESVDLAEEALRACWNWFFANCSGDSNNKNGIEQIDRKLLLQAA